MSISPRLSNWFCNHVFTQCCSLGGFHHNTTVGLSNVYTITSAAFSRCCEFLSISFPHLLRNATFGNSINKPYNKVLGASQFKGEILIVKPFPQTPEAHPNLVKPSSKFKDPINSKGTGADTKILWATTHPYTQQLQPQPSPIKFKDPIQ